MSDEIDKDMERLARSITDPIIVYPPADSSSLPDYLKADIRLERLARDMGMKSEEKLEEATDSEALAYLMTASLVAPIREEWYAVYVHLFDKYLARREVEPPPDLAEDLERYRVLDNYKQSHLTDLKRWIQKQKDQHYRMKRGPVVDDPEKSEPLRQLGLDLFDDGE